VYHDRDGRARDETRQPVIIARRISLHLVCVGVYRAHRDGGAGTCAACGKPSPCQPRQHAATVIEAHADDPGRYDAAPDSSMAG
jgi:hypothetical protein